jgi:hypothetical protein
VTPAKVAQISRFGLHLRDQRLMAFTDKQMVAKGSIVRPPKSINLPNDFAVRNSQCKNGNLTSAKFIAHFLARV